METVFAFDIDADGTNSIFSRNCRSKMPTVKPHHVGNAPDGAGRPLGRTVGPYRQFDPVESDHRESALCVHSPALKLTQPPSVYQPR
jgi:hypothetical protein